LLLEARVRTEVLEMKLQLSAVALSAVLAACATPQSASLRSGASAASEPASSTITLIKPVEPQATAKFDVAEGDLWRVHVINATDAQIMGMILDGKQIWFDSPFTRTCANDALTTCPSDENAWRQILIQTCGQVTQTMALVYRDSRDNQIYRSSAVKLTPQCGARGGLIVFRDG
jgi:hypothetical protein